MNCILYVIIFIIGTVFGSFLTLATYRIPIHKDITHEHSFCPNCNHKLTFLDLIPILSYVFLRGKCRHCKKKISPRYFIIEFVTGISFVMLAFALDINVYSITKTQIIELIIGILYLIFLYLVAGIDIEHNKIDKGVLIYGITISCINIIYQYIYCLAYGQIYNLNRIIVYLLFTIILVIANLNLIKKTKKYDYCIDLIIVAIIMSLYTYEITTILSVIGCLLIVSFKLLISKIFNKNKTHKKMPMAFYLVVSNIIILIISYIITQSIR